MSIYEIALAIADAFGLDKKYIHPVATKDLSLPAKRPLSTGFDLNKSIAQINLPSYSFTERLQVFKSQLDSLKIVAGLKKSLIVNKFDRFFIFYYSDLFYICSPNFYGIVHCENLIVRKGK